MNDPFVEVVINFGYIANKSPVHSKVFNSVPSDDVHDSSFEVLPRDIPDIYVSLIGPSDDQTGVQSVLVGG